MSFEKNADIEISGKFISVTDDGKYCVKINGISNVLFEIDPQYIHSSMPSSSNESKRRKSKKNKKRSSKIRNDSDDWGAFDDSKTNDNDNANDEPLPEPEVEPEPEPTVKAKVKTPVVNDDSGYENDKNDDFKEKPPPKKALPSGGTEKFHPKHKLKKLAVEEDGTVLRTTASGSVMCGFGTVVCNEIGKMYHWKLKILEGNDVNFGVITSDQCKKNKKQMWWLTDIGYSCWSDDGQVYHSDKYKKYFDKFGEGDVVDIYLNLKKNNISFALNDAKGGKAFKTAKETDYRLAIGFSGHPHSIKLLEFSAE